MRTIITIIILSIATLLSAQTTKQVNATYLSTFEKAGMEGACLYEITCKSETGSTLIFTDIFHGQYNESLMKILCDERKLSDQEAEKFNETGKVDRTLKSSVGKKFKIKYTESDCMSIESAEIAGPVQDTTLSRIQKEQLAFLAKNPCPNCPAEVIKPFLKAQIPKLDKEATEARHDKERAGIIDAKNYVQEALKINSYFTYYFSSTRASVVINHKIRSKNLAVQMKKVNNKWQAIGIDDSWWFCDGMAEEEVINDEKQIAACGKYINNCIANKK